MLLALSLIINLPTYLLGGVIIFLTIEEALIEIKLFIFSPIYPENETTTMLIRLIISGHLATTK